MKYDVIIANDKEELVNKVNEFLHQGYEPFGMLIVNRYGYKNVYTQVVIKKE